MSSSTMSGRARDQPRTARSSRGTGLIREELPGPILNSWKRGTCSETNDRGRGGTVRCVLESHVARSAALRGAPLQIYAPIARGRVFAFVEPKAPRRAVDPRRRTFQFQKYTDRSF